MDLRLSMRQVAEGVVEHGVPGSRATHRSDSPVQVTNWQQAEWWGWSRTPVRIGCALSLGRPLG